MIRRAHTGPITREEVHAIGSLLETASVMGETVAIDIGYVAQLLLVAAHRMGSEDDEKAVFLDQAG